MGRGAYREPFVGAGAVFFLLFAETRPAFLSDANADLVDAYLAIRDEPDATIAALARHQRAFDEAAAADRTAKPGTPSRYKATYYALRSVAPASLSVPERAARLIAISKTCVNGIYRVNNDGGFNVPCGKNTGKDGNRVVPRLYRDENVRKVSAALQGVDIRRRDGIEVVREAEPGDMIYLDPPFDALSETANFTDYTPGGFTAEQQAQLAAAVREAAARGVRIAVSNHDTPRIRALYAGSKFIQIEATRSISPSAKGRAPAPELLILTY